MNSICNLTSQLKNAFKSNQKFVYNFFHFLGRLKKENSVNKNEFCL